MHYVVVMEIPHRLQQHAHDRPGGALWIPPSLDDAVEEVTASDQLHHDEDAVSRLESVLKI